MNSREYARVLTKRWRVAIAGFLGILAIVATIGFFTPVRYASQTQIFVSTQVDAGNVNQQLFQGGSFTADRVTSYTDIAKSPRVTSAAVRQAGSSLTPEQLAANITADSPSKSVLINISVRDRSPEEAAALTNAVAARLSQVIQELETPPGTNRSPVLAAIVNPATPATSPVTPNWPLLLALGVLGGLIVGAGLAILRENLDSSVKTEEDLERATSVPSIGRVAYEDSGRILVADGRDRRSEDLRQLRTNLQYCSVDSPVRTVLVTSSVAGEGKSSTTANLAVALAELGMRVTVVDADLRRPRMAEYFGVANSAGFTSVLIGRANLDEVVQPVRANLSLLASGPSPYNPSELLASARASQVLESLSERNDFVLVDSPPVLPVADSRVLAPRTDGVVLIVRAGVTTAQQVREGVDSLQRVRANLIGTVLNGVQLSRSANRYYGEYAAAPKQVNDRSGQFVEPPTEHIPGRGTNGTSGQKPSPRPRPPSPVQ